MTKRLRSLCLLTIAALLLTTGAAFARPAAKQAGRTVRPLAVLQPDDYEPDDSTATAQVENGASVHTIAYDPAAPDHDWVKISADATGQPFVLQSQFRNGYLDMWMYVYELDTDGALKELDSDDDMWSFNGYGSELFFVAPHPGDFYIDNYARDENWGTYDLFVKAGLGRRIAGVDRYSTSVAISRMMWPDAENFAYDEGPANIVVANSETIDALTAGAFGAAFGDAPLLLTTRDALPTVVKDEIVRLAMGATTYEVPPTVYVIGGPDKISETQFELIESLPYVNHVVRLAGANRFATAAAVASASADAGNVNDTAFLCNGAGIADALSAAPLAVDNGAPILLTGAAQLSNETSQWLNDHPGVTKVVAVGGEDKIAPAILESLADASLDVTRVAGDNRYQTSAKLARFAVDNFSASTDSIVLASGQRFADGLCGAPMAAMLGAPVLLTPSASLDASVSAYYQDYPTSEVSYILGGTPSISREVEQVFDALWKPVD